MALADSASLMLQLAIMRQRLQQQLQQGRSGRPAAACTPQPAVMLAAALRLVGCLCGGLDRHESLADGALAGLQGAARAAATGQRLRRLEPRGESGSVCALTLAGCTQVLFHVNTSSIKSMGAKSTHARRHSTLDSFSTAVVP
jgi:hypothetical protein